LKLSAFDHKQKSYFGLTKYNAQQQNFYSNLIYQSIIRTTTHRFRTGLSFVYDKYNEDFQTANYRRTEIVPGAFFEYTFTPSEKFDIVAGIREDYNSLYGWFTTPRLNVRYEPFKGTVIRASAGRGQRTANIFAENNGVFISSRQVNIVASDAAGAYGLQPEVAWNKGISVDQKFKLFSRIASLGLDYFRNDFTNQVVIDVESPREMKLYNLTGKSYSNSLQGELSFMPVQNLDVRLAYRIFDVKTTYNDQLLQKPLTARDRAFGNVAYEKKGWKFDYTVSYSGRKRLPSTTANPAAHQYPSHSPAFAVMNAQVSKSLGGKSSLDVYIGGENLTNYFQKNAIVAPEQPFSPYFDASMMWGPMTGRMFYAGFRFKIK
jgi:outer membrane receptor for ferrienterochelin and colicin